MAWADREAFVYKLEPLENSLARAKLDRKRRGSGPIVLLDHYDNCASGGTMDTTAVLGGDPERGPGERRRLRDLRPRGGAGR